MSGGWRPIDVVPLHSDPLPTGCYWACEYPERPPDPALTWWDWRCYGCFRHGEAVVNGDPEWVATHAGDDGRIAAQDTALAMSVEDARRYHERSSA